MLAVISPAKSLNEQPLRPEAPLSRPQFSEDAQTLVNKLKRMSVRKLSQLMNISEKLGELNRDRFASWTMDADSAAAHCAVTLFHGDVYLGMEAGSFSTDEFQFLNRHLRILSGLYGLLRPLDAIQPHRLEMGTTLPTRRGKNLYSFWGRRITNAINAQLQELNSRTLINLASNEYFSAVHVDRLDAQVITPVFKDWNRDSYRVLSFFAKRARGRMVREIVSGRLTNPEELKSVKFDGYEFRDNLSDHSTWVFARDKKP